ncbi:MAG: hypothetical protein MZW92_53315 [Comamonadaceae bacterium]|nr:hypothetical protein [Comamonadaceae bacterium]
MTAFFTGKGPGSYLIQLKVTDRTATSYPSSGSPICPTRTRRIVTVLSSTRSRLRLRQRPAGAGQAPQGAAHLVPQRGAPLQRLSRHGLRGPHSRSRRRRRPIPPSSTWRVVNGTTYYYVIRPANLLDQESCQSNQASARPVAR